MVQSKLRSWPELKDPKYLEDPLVTTESWLKGKHTQDGAENLWRIHDKLYDLTEWMHKHPGGEHFLQISKGTDITELFETHHITLAAENLLPVFYVKEAATPRNSPYTFHPEGFYRVLKKRVLQELPSIPRSVRFKAKVINDSAIAIAFTLLVIGSVLKSYSIGLMAAFPLCCGIIAAHNFFHQKTNWRRFYFDLTFLSHREWVVSHLMSHHIYPNTKMDLEVTMFDPFFQWLPSSDKSWVNRYLCRFYAPVIYGFTFFVQGIMRITLKGFHSHDLTNLIVPGLILIASSWNFMFSLKLYLGLVWLTSTIFVFIGTTAAHHAPNLFHEGDVPRDDRDWGLQQLDAVTDRVEINGSLMLALFTFGNHALHHLFPALDHGILEYLQPVFQKTCKEFNFKYELTPFWTLVNDQYLQLARNTPRVFPIKLLVTPS